MTIYVVVIKTEYWNGCPCCDQERMNGFHVESAWSAIEAAENRIKVLKKEYAKKSFQGSTVDDIYVEATTLNT